MSNSRRKRIALFCPSLRGGGAERVMVQLANEFAEQDLDVDLVLASAQGEYHSEISSKVNIVDLKSHRVLASLPKLILYLHQKQPTTMLSTLGYANVVAGLARVVSNSKVRLFLREASTLEPDEMSFKGKVVFKMMSSIYRSADGIIAISSGVKESLIEQVNIESDKIHVIYNPVIHSAMYELAKEKITHPWFRPGYKGQVVLAAGRLAKEKDYPTMIHAFAKVNSDAKLMILGQGSEHEKLKGLIKELGVEERVQMLGFVKNPFAYMARADLFVLSSAWEGLGNVLIQAMALNIRVVSTNCPGGPAEVLDHGRWGTLVPAGDSDALAIAIEDALNRQGEMSYPAECLDRFDTKKIAAEYLSLLIPDFEYVSTNIPI